MDVIKLLEHLNNYQPIDEKEENNKLVIIQAIQNSPNIFERSNKLFHISSSSWIVNQDFTKALLCYHNIYDSYSWTGGHNDGDVDCLKVAYNEAVEETGIKEFKILSDKIMGIDILPVTEHYKNGEYINWHLHLNVTYLLQANDKDRLIISEKENSDLKWFTFEQIPEVVREEDMIETYQKLIKKTKEKAWQF